MKTQRSLLSFLTVPLLLSACASDPYEGRGEYFALTQRHIIELDLSVIKPSQTAQTQQSAKQLALIQSQVSEKDASPSNDKMYRFTLKEGETYRSAIRRWSKKAGYNNVVWSMDESGMSAINGTNSELVDYHGTLKKAMSLLAAKLNTPIRLTVSEKDKVLGVYDFDEEPKLTHIKGSSLKDVVRNIVINYGLKWSDDANDSRSWLALNDYTFGANYYLLTRENDVNSALQVVLSSYPVRSEILESTNQVFILEEN